jgi:hypothetical protein
MRAIAALSSKIFAQHTRTKASVTLYVCKFPGPRSLLPVLLEREAAPQGKHADLTKVLFWLFAWQDPFRLALLLSGDVHLH